jgi:hypothetical protein
MPSILRNLERPNWLPPSSPEIIRAPAGIPDDALAVMTSVNYGVLPWLFDAYFTPIAEVVAMVPNEERVPWSDDQRLPQ